MAESALTLRDATIRYGRLTAVDGVSLTIAPGETLGLVGESGCGKSSVARAIAGLQPLSAGSLAIGGEVMAEATATRRRDLQRAIQLLFQDPVSSLSPRLTVKALITEPLRIRRAATPENWERILALSARIGLGEQLFGRYPHQLSGGQARRVALLRAIAAAPSVIVADEPTAGLDISIQGELLNLLRGLRDELGLSYLFISHNLNVVGRVTDRVAIMYLGQIVESGETRRIFSAPAHPYTRALLSSNLTIDPARRKKREILKGELPSPHDPPSGCRFHGRCPIAQPVCAERQPQLASPGEGRAVACHFPLGDSRSPYAMAG